MDQTRSKQIKMDQRGSRQTKGDQHDLWVGVRVVGVGRGIFNQIKADQDGSKGIKADQRRSVSFVDRG